MSPPGRPVRVPISNRMTAASAVNDQAFVLNASPVRLLRREEVTGNPVTNHRAFSASEYVDMDPWSRGLSALFGRYRWVKRALEWVPKTAVTSEGEIVLGHLSDVTDVRRSKDTTVAIPRLTSQWDGLPEDVEALQPSASFPVRERFIFPLPVSGEWSRHDAERDFEVTKTQEPSTTRETGVDEAILPFMRDGITLGHVSGLSKVGGGGTSLSDYGHFRVVGELELCDRNTSHAGNPASPTPSRAVQSKDLRLEPVTLSLEDIHHLQISETGRITRSGTERVTSPFLGVSLTEESFPDGSRPYGKAVIQYDPQRSGWDSSLLALGPGVGLLEGESRGLRFEKLPSGYLVTSTGGVSTLAVVFPDGGFAWLSSRPTTG